MFNYQPRVEELELLLLSLNKRNYTMTKNKSQTKMRDALRQLRQPKSVYLEYLNSSEEEQRFLEHVIQTVLEKGYMPA